MLARDVMTAKVVVAGPNSTVVDIADLMIRHRISAVPIVDGDGQLLGIVSEGDMIKKNQPVGKPQRSWWLSALGGTAVTAEEFTQTRRVKASDIMTREVATAHPDTPVQQIAETLERRRIKRVPIVDDGRVVGIVSRANLLQALTAQRAAIADHPSADDRSLRAAVLEAVHTGMIADAPHLNVVVKDGTAYFWGDVASREQRQTLIATARDIAGVRDVVDHLHVNPSA